MLYTNYQKYIKRSSQYEMCRECFTRKDMVYTSVRYSNCGESFDITNGEKIFMRRRGTNCRKNVRIVVVMEAIRHLLGAAMKKSLKISSKKPY